MPDELYLAIFAAALVLVLVAKAAFFIHLHRNSKRNAKKPPDDWYPPYP